MTGTVRVENLSKTYQVRQRKGLFKSVRSSVEALKGISLEVLPGEIFGLRTQWGGENYPIKVLTTLLLPTSGEAWSTLSHPAPRKSGAVYGWLHVDGARPVLEADRAREPGILRSALPPFTIRTRKRQRKSWSKPSE
jgi:ABC-type uncharacterized transport system ATPase subunit